MDGVPFGQQFKNGVAADIAGPAGHQNAHVLPLMMRSEDGSQVIDPAYRGPFTISLLSMRDRQMMQLPEKLAARASGLVNLRHYCRGWLRLSATRDK